MKSIKLLLSIAALSLSFNSSASLIEYAGFSRDTSSNIFQGQNLDWRFANEHDFNRGLSSNGKFTSDSLGWRTASNAEVAAMLNTFDIQSVGSFVADENINQGGISGWAGFKFDNIFNFYAILSGNYPHISVGDSITSIWGFPSIRFGDDQDGDGKLNIISGFAEWLNWDNIPLEYRSPIEDAVFNPVTGMLMMPDSILFDFHFDSYDNGSGSFLLVRETNYTTPVPEPISLILIGFGLLGLATVRRIKS